MHILWALSTNGPPRFGALRRHIEGISSRVLTERLRVWSIRGSSTATTNQTIPPSVTCGIAKRMKDIAELDQLARKRQQEHLPAIRAKT
jgi:DNA-binding HxlR family transcriptional regulator